jgi:hypothetical protein
MKKLKDMPEMEKSVQILKDIGINNYRQIIRDHWILDLFNNHLNQPVIVYEATN